MKIRRAAGPPPVTRRDVVDAASRLENRVVRTPLVAFEGIAPKLKCEGLQFTGSFKYRGALNAIEVLEPSSVVTASSGNHALALAHATPPGTPLTVVMQSTAPQHKQRMARAAGIRVQLIDGDVSARDMLAERLALETGATLISSSDHRAVIAGQGTVALEILQQDEDLEWIFVPVGGGGLAAGSILAVENCGRVRIVGVEPEGADDASRSFITGVRTAVTDVRTICDGVRHTELADLPRPIIMAGIHDIVTVSDDEVRSAQCLLHRLGVAAESTGALAFAGALRDQRRNAVAVVSGGNDAFPASHLRTVAG